MILNVTCYMLNVRIECNDDDDCYIVTLSRGDDVSFESFWSLRFKFRKSCGVCT